MKQFIFRYKFVKILLFAIATSIVGNKMSAQEDFYDINYIREIKINFYQDNWKQILDSLFSSGDSESRIKADVTIDGTTYLGCGIRYKGYSSWNADETKNPFSINLDYTYANQNHHGYSKLKLSNVIYDPSFVREVIAYRIARKYMPASGANFANVYISDTLIGIYTNVEAVDDLFTEKHFGSSKNPFFKGNPTTLVFPFGQNANLAFTHGADSSGYKPFYQMESEYGWTDLFNFINVLNNDTANISQVLNVDRALWMHAFNYSILNLDSYIAYAQNFYVYKADDQRFNTILWDLNMSFGSFRHSDGATNFQGVSMADIAILDPLKHLSFSISPRPLMKNLFKNSTYKKMYLAHIRTIINENIANGDYLDIGEQLHELIDASVLNDTNKFYSYQSFQENLYSNVGVSTEEFPGLENLMEARLAYLLTYTGISGYPQLTPIENSQDFAIKNEALDLRTKVADANSVKLFYRFNSDEAFSSVEMFDNGLENDGNAGDSIYGAEIIPNGKIVQYYFWAENDSSGSFLPERAAYDFFSIPQNPEQNDLVINELHYSNNYFDGFAEQSDVEWLEIFNTTDESVFIQNLSLEFGQQVYILPDTIMESKSFLLIDPSSLEISSLSAVGTSSEFIYLNFANDYIIDSISPVFCNANRSIGRYPNGNGGVVVLNPTPESFNKLEDFTNEDFIVYPNPANNKFYYEGVSGKTISKVEAFSTNGQIVFSKEFSNSLVFSGEIDVTNWYSGVYYIKFYGVDFCQIKKIIVVKSI